MRKVTNKRKSKQESEPEQEVEKKDADSDDGDNDDGAKSDNNGDDAENEGGAVSDDEKTTKKKNNKKGANNKKAKGSEKAEKKAEKKDKDDKVKKADKDEDEKEEEDEEEEDYEVEDIMEHKFVRGKRVFRIRWKGFKEADDTWEPEATLSCPDIVKKYLEAHPDDKASSSPKGKKRSNDDKKGSSKNAKKSKTDKKNDENKTEKNGDKDDNDEDESGDEKDFEVDRIIDVHTKKNGKKEFLIRWKGYTEKHDTWEPEDNLNCPDIISKYLAKADHCRQNSKELRDHPMHTKRFTLAAVATGRRLSKRNDGRQRAVYYDAE